MTTAEKQVEYHLKYRIKNREKLRERSRIYYIKNKEKILALRKQDVIDNPEKYIAKSAKYYQKRKKEIHEYRKDRYKNNIQYKLSLILRRKLHLTVTKKYSSAVDYVGCSLKQLEIYLESLFKEGMSWENHGLHGWHIDHIIPCSSFDLTKLEEQKKCFHYTNLQPLWAKDNLNKGAKLNWKKKGVCSG